MYFVKILVLVYATFASTAFFLIQRNSSRIISYKLHVTWYMSSMNTKIKKGWFVNVYRDIAVMIGVFILFLGVWFGAPALWEYTQQALPLPDSIPTSLSQPEQASLQKAAQNLKKELWSGSQKESKKYRELGEIYEKLGYVQKSAKAYKTALRQNGEDVEVIYALSRLYEKGERYDEAQDYFIRAYEKNPSEIEFYHDYAEFLATKLHDPQAARGVYLKGLLTTSNNGDLMKIFADFLEKNGYTSEAELYRTYLKSIDQNKSAPKELKK